MGKMRVPMSKTFTNVKDYGNTADANANGSVEANVHTIFGAYKIIE